jgi:hypothetical protein
MSALEAEATDVTVESVLALMRRLPPRDRLRVIAAALPEAERDLPTEPKQQAAKRPLRSLYGILQEYGPAPSAEEIDEARREAWANFPREDI